jgi:serine/threonine protein kinase
MALGNSDSPLMKSIGKYDLVAKIAEGGMGTVWKGRNRDTEAVVAIKIVPPNMAKNQVLLKRFEQEWKAANLLDHPNIVRALDFCGTGSTPFLVMEYVDGESLGQRLEREGRLPEAEAVRIISLVCQGLHRAHKQGLIHRDIKPDNIMVTGDGQVKVTDLGLVKDVDAELNLTKTGRGLGTPHFMAPEQFRNAKNADIRCDIYSLGATLYQMVTGEVPFAKTSGPLDAWMKKANNEIAPPRQLVPELSERIDWAIRRAMSPNPELRPGSCREFVEDLTGQSARQVASAEETPSAVQDVWYLWYQDEEGTKHTVKGTTDGIRRSLQESLLGDASNVRACRTKSGPFEPLLTYAEFRDLLVTPAPVAVASGPSGVTPAKTDSSSWPRTLTPVPEGSKNSNSGSGPDSGVVPHIRLRSTGRATQRVEWLQWLLMLLVALATAIGAAYLLSK